MQTAAQVNLILLCISADWFYILSLSCPKCIYIFILQLVWLFYVCTICYLLLCILFTLYYVYTLLFTSILFVINTNYVISISMFPHALSKKTLQQLLLHISLKMCISLPILRSIYMFLHTFSIPISLLTVRHYSKTSSTVLKHGKLYSFHKLITTIYLKYVYNDLKFCWKIHCLL